MGNLKNNKDLKKELEKEGPSSNITSSQSLFKVEAKVDIKPYHGEIEIINLNQ